MEKERKSAARHFTELTAEISLTWTKSGPSKTCSFTVKKNPVTSSSLAPLCIFFHSLPILPSPPLQLIQFFTVSL